MSQDGVKWTCQICTYENYPKAVRCTICSSPKQSHVISQDQSQDIYMMAPLISETCSNSASESSTSSNPYNKWTCHMCTYMNWPRAGRCVQCLMPRKHNSPPSPNENNSAQNYASSDQDSSSLYSDSYHNDRNKSWSRSIKWSCPSCTYENWPKSTKCVICHASRPKSEQSSQVLPEVDDCRARSLTPNSEMRNRLSPPNTQNVINSNPSSRRRPNQWCSENNTIQVSAPLPSASGVPHAANNYFEERRLRQARRKTREVDWTWLNACTGVVEGDTEPVIEYLTMDGDPARQLNADEVAVLGRPSAFDVGYTLVHLAIRFQRDDLLTLLLSHTGVSHPVAKRVPSDVSRDTAADLRRQIAASLKQRRGDFPCYFATDFVTFSLPPEVEDFPHVIRKRLFDELLDRDVQKELEEESPIINWSLELTNRLGSRLYALWNRSAGDCLLDSALQATWGVFDRDNTLRRALGDSLCEAASVFKPVFNSLIPLTSIIHVKRLSVDLKNILVNQNTGRLYPRWKEAETLQANLMHFSLDDAQWQEDWAMLLSLASQPGSALEQMHIFTLAHILRRPIIVYGVKYVKSFRGEALGYARFEGIYLPLLWEPTFCWKSPIALGYTRGHFSALIGIEPESEGVLGAGANTRPTDDLQVIFLPLMTADHQRLPVHFLTQEELGREEEIMKQWLDCCVTEGGILVAQQKIPRRPLLVAQMIEEWLDFYRSLIHRSSNHHMTATSPEQHTQVYSSDGDSDQE